jgi:hypothetical protein
VAANWPSGGNFLCSSEIESDHVPLKCQCQTGVPHSWVRIFLKLKAVYVSAVSKGLPCNSLPHPSPTLSLLTGTFNMDLEYTGSSYARHIPPGEITYYVLQSVSARYFKSILFAVDVYRLYINMANIVTSCHVNETNDAS